MTLTNAPTLETDRLILRGPQVSDFDPLADFYASDQCIGFGEKMKRDDAWRWFALNIGHWHIHGYGYFSIVEKASGKPAGLSGIWNPEGWPEPELGYALFAEFEGKGIAYEASVRTRKWAYSDLGFTTLSSHIVPDNTRSMALAARLGAVYESSYVNPHMGEDQIFRHPAPEELA
ncbi:GNAT family N-acetyltransferase [Amylibacter sp. IMCC11727]|uniref:GNAT family N-acetyltransferase n=1 Tax=Amylibacter sp. IMCC11727 TaxID=3039851 RepID=UPI00244DA82E|nr:GNAT family N-acetyltransferase [Amylibacter sp. IMCC11727]WGI21199.1 GNAT family N-acetyltransferase [Amylibacter sp. IMCC11727]